MMKRSMINLSTQEIEKGIVMGSNFAKQYERDQFATGFAAVNAAAFGGASEISRTVPAPHASAFGPGGLNLTDFQRELAALERRQQGSMPAPGAADNLEETPDGWAAEYAATPALQYEFISAENYVCFKKAVAKGLVKLDSRPADFAPDPRIASAADRDRWASEFHSDPSITAEFLTEASYVGYMAARKRGGATLHRGAGGR